MTQVRIGRWSTLAAVSLLSVLLAHAGSAQAAEEKVELWVEVVHASESGSTVDPALANMRDAFSKGGFKYSSYRRLSREKITLRRGEPWEHRLQNERHVKLTLEQIKDGSAEVKVDAPPIHTRYTLGREGSVFVQGGAHNGGMLFLVLSPVKKD